MHFETREDYVAWALVVLFAASDKTNNNSIGNAFEHANKLADLVYGTQAQAAHPSRLLGKHRPVEQPFSTPNKPPPAPGDKATATEASGPNG